MSPAIQRKEGGGGWPEEERRGAPEHVPLNAQVGVGVRSARPLRADPRARLLPRLRAPQPTVGDFWSLVSDAFGRAEPRRTRYPTYAAGRRQGDLDSRSANYYDVELG